MISTTPNSNVELSIIQTSLQANKELITDFYGIEDLTWGVDPLNPLDVASFCKIEIAPSTSMWRENPNILLLQSNKSYRFHFDFVTDQQFGYAVENSELDDFSIIITPNRIINLPFDKWNNIFSNQNISSHTIDSNFKLRLILDANGNSMILDTVSNLQSGLTFTYTIYFNFKTEFDGIQTTRYCRYDPLIRTNSEDEGYGVIS